MRFWLYVCSYKGTVTPVCFWHGGLRMLMKQTFTRRVHCWHVAYVRHIPILISSTFNSLRLTTKSKCILKCVIGRVSNVLWSQKKSMMECQRSWWNIAVAYSPIFNGVSENCSVWPLGGSMWHCMALFKPVNHRFPSKLEYLHTSIN